MVVFVVGIIMIEDMIGVMMIGIIIVDYIEEEVEEEEDGELFKIGIRFIEGGYFFFIIVVEDIDYVLDFDYIYFVVIKV